MAITLQEAIEKSPSVIKEEEARNMQEKESLYNEITNMLDKIIAYNLPKILIKPIVVTWFLPTNIKEAKEVASMYSDFTIEFRNWETSVSIKLADKDWDWGGYGVKEVKEESPLGGYAVNNPSPLTKAKQMVRDWFSCK